MDVEESIERIEHDDDLIVVCLSTFLSSNPTLPHLSCLHLSPLTLPSLISLASISLASISLLSISLPSNSLLLYISLPPSLPPSLSILPLPYMVSIISGSTRCQRPGGDSHATKPEFTTGESLLLLVRSVQPTSGSPSPSLFWSLSPAYPWSTKYAPHVPPVVF